MIDPAPKLRLLARAELLKLRVAGRVFVSRLAFYLLASLFACFALAALSVAGFLALVPVLGGPLAALVTAGVLLLLCLVAVGVASLIRGGRSAELVEQAEDTAIAGLRQDIAEAEAELRALRSQVGTLTGGGAKGALASLIAAALQPLVNALIRRLLR